MNKHPNKHLFSFATIAAIAGNNDKQLPKSFESLKLKAALQSAEKRLLWIGNAAFCVINRGGVPLRESGGCGRRAKKGIGVGAHSKGYAFSQIWLQMCVCCFEMRLRPSTRCSKFLKGILWKLLERCAKRYKSCPAIFCNGLLKLFKLPVVLKYYPAKQQILWLINFYTKSVDHLLYTPGAYLSYHLTGNLLSFLSSSRPLVFS